MNYNILKYYLLLPFLFLIQACHGQIKNNNVESTNQIDRQPAVAGSFYPANAQLLMSALKEAFAKAEPKKHQEM
jgi:hypothetical protein